MKKVLYVSYDGMTDPLGQSQVLPYISGLSKEGYEFHLISFEKEDKFNIHKDHIQSICDESGIKWHPQDYKNEGGLKKTIKQVRRMKRVVRYLQEKHNFDIVHCRSYISALSGLALKRKHNVKFVFDMRGFWANERIDGNIWTLSNPIFKRIYNYFKKKEIEFLSEADYTISLTENGRDEINSWKAFQSKKPPIQIIPCCVNLDLFNPENTTTIQISEAKKRLGIEPNQFVLGYVGSIGTWYMLPEMLDYFKVLKRKNNNAVFLFISGENPKHIMNEVEKKGIDQASIFIQSVLHKEVPLHISLFDESIFFIRASYSKKASSPTKQGEIMAMGIPLICNAGVGDTDRIVEKYHSGKIISEFSDEAYSIAIDDNGTFNRERTMEGAREYFSLKEGVKNYLNVYKAIDG
ncbi:MAG: glycosyltransferase [Flavobacteriales bacterium]|nr:glycosyltransferase [Flavobacteriales bacterium]